MGTCLILMDLAFRNCYYSLWRHLHRYLLSSVHWYLLSSVQLLKCWCSSSTSIPLSEGCPSSLCCLYGLLVPEDLYCSSHFSLWICMRVGAVLSSSARHWSCKGLSGGSIHSWLLWSVHKSSHSSETCKLTHRALICLLFSHILLRFTVFFTYQLKKYS